MSYMANRDAAEAAATPVPATIIWLLLFALERVWQIVDTVQYASQDVRKYHVTWYERHHLLFMLNSFACR